MPSRVLCESSFSRVINAPIESIDIAEWLFRLTNAEFQRCCPPDHIAFGLSTTDGGRRMAINVETIGDCLVVQKYFGEIEERHHCRMVSTSDVFSPLGRTTAEVVWELSVERFDACGCEYVNRVTASATDAFLALLEQHDIPFLQAAAARDEVAARHNEKETAGFAASIERYVQR